MYGTFTIIISFVFYVSTNTVASESSAETYIRSFNFFKEKYDKTYSTDEEEQNAFFNFMDNMKKAAALNEKTHDSTYYVLDRYADVDTDFMEEHYAVTVNPIASEPLGNIKADIAQEIKRSKNEKVLENTELFDLDHADELYKKYLKSNIKEAPKGKLQRNIHFLRFVKSLVAVNRNHINGDGTSKIDEHADELQQPEEFSY